MNLSTKTGQVQLSPHVPCVDIRRKLPKVLLGPSDSTTRNDPESGP